MNPKQKYLYLIAAERTYNGKKVKYGNVGDAFDVEARLKNADYARKAGGGNWKIIKTWPMPAGMRDYSVHGQLTTLFDMHGDPDQTGNREEFLFDCSTQVAIDRVSKALNVAAGKANKAHSFKMRPEQQACCDKAVNAFDAGTTKFLMDCKMRFGKTFTSYQIVKKMKAENVLILTYKPAVESSWAEDLTTHVDFDGIKFNNIVDGNSKSNGVYFSSMQGILSEDHHDTDKRQWIFDESWDLIIFDEEHYGSRSEKAKNILQKLESNGTKWLMLSGTPFQARLRGEYTPEQMYRWTYVDEQRAKKNWHKQNCANQCIC